MGIISGYSQKNNGSRKLEQHYGDIKSSGQKRTDNQALGSKYQKILFEYREVLADYKESLLRIAQSKSAEVIVDTAQMEKILGRYQYELEKLKAEKNQMADKVNRNASDIEAVLSQYKLELQRIMGEQRHGTQFVEEDFLVSQQSFDDKEADTDQVEKMLSDYKEALAYYKDCLMQYEEKVGTYDDKLNEYAQENPGHMAEVQNALDFTYIKEQTNKISEQLDLVASKNSNKVSESLEDFEEVKKMLEDLIRFVTKLEKGIVDAVKINGEKNKEELTVLLEEIMMQTISSKRGIRPMQVFGLLLNLATVGGVAILILFQIGVFVL